MRGAKRRGNLGKALTLIAPAIVGERTAGPGGALTVRTRHRQNGKRFRFVIARPRRGRGNLGKAVTLIAHAIVGERHAAPGYALTVRTSHRQNGKRFRFVIARRPTADVTP